MTRRLFALDHAFPQPIVASLAELFEELAELVPIQEIDPRMPLLDDWQVMLALHHDRRPWDGLITTDSSLLYLPRELWTLTRTKLSLVVTEDAGDDPIKATGLLFVHLKSICEKTRADRAQLWTLRARDVQPKDPMLQVESAANHRHMTSGAFLDEGRMSHVEFMEDPLA